MTLHFFKNRNGCAWRLDCVDFFDLNGNDDISKTKFQFFLWMLTHSLDAVSNAYINITRQIWSSHCGGIKYLFYVDAVQFMLETDVSAIKKFAKD